MSIKPSQITAGSRFHAHDGSTGEVAVATKNSNGTYAYQVTYDAPVDGFRTGTLGWADLKFVNGEKASRA